jgi:hypothetical protein
MTELDRPIVIVGTGRCGSTMLHRIVARHEDVGWLSTFNEVFPERASLSVFSNLYRAPLPMRIKHLRAFPKPFEAYRFWEHFFPGFSRRDRPLTAEDVPEAGIEPARRKVAQILRFQRKRRFLAKVTGWSRMSYFDRIFPDALFVFLRREHRSVVSSWIEAGWLDVTTAPDSPEWQWGEVPGEYRRLWEDLGGGRALAAALKIRLDLDDIEENLARFRERTHELDYEDLITRPRESLHALTEFCDLPWSARWQAYVDSLGFYNPIDKWRKHLSAEEGEQVQEFFRRAEALRPVRA